MCLPISPYLAHHPWCQRQRPSLRWIRAKHRSGIPRYVIANSDFPAASLVCSYILLVRPGWRYPGW